MGLIDALVYGLRDVFDTSDTLLPRRSRIKFTSGVTDDPAHDRIVVDTGSVSVGGSNTQVQYNNAGAPAGTANLTVVSGNVNHAGTPRHNEGYDVFVASGSGTAFCLSQWNALKTTNATQGTLSSIAVAAATYGDCFITVTSEVTYRYVSGGAGGNYAHKATFHRSSGTLTRVAISDNSDSSLKSGTPPGGVDVAASGNDTILVLATGIAATNIQWVSSLHVQIATTASL